MKIIDLTKCNSGSCRTFRKWGTIILVLVLGGLEILDNLPKSFSWIVVSIVLSICLYILFDIHERVLNNREPRFEGHDKIKNEIVCRIEEEYYHNKTQPVHLKIIGVALAYTTPWINEELRKFLNKNTNVSVEIEACMVSPNFLDECAFHECCPRKWVRDAENNLETLRSYPNDNDLSLKNRLRVTVYVYESIPHWHGILVNDRFLYLGRSDWTHENSNGAPELSIGQNIYRYYQINDIHGGDERVQLFKHWFDFYKNYEKRKLQKRQQIVG